MANLFPAVLSCDQPELSCEKLMRSSDEVKNRRKKKKPKTKKKIAKGIIKFLNPTFNVWDTAGNKLLSI